MLPPSGSCEQAPPLVRIAQQRPQAGRACLLGTCLRGQVGRCPCASGSGCRVRSAPGRWPWSPPTEGPMLRVDPRGWVLLAQPPRDKLVGWGSYRVSLLCILRLHPSGLTGPRLGNACGITSLGQKPDRLHPPLGSIGSGYAYLPCWSCGLPSPGSSSSGSCTSPSVTPFPQRWRFPREWSRPLIHSLRS